MYKTDHVGITCTSTQSEACCLCHFATSSGLPWWAPPPFFSVNDGDIIISTPVTSNCGFLSYPICRRIIQLELLADSSYIFRLMRSQLDRPDALRALRVLVGGSTDAAHHNDQLFRLEVGLELPRRPLSDATNHPERRHGQLRGPTRARPRRRRRGGSSVGGSGAENERRHGDAYARGTPFLAPVASVPTGKAFHLREKRETLPRV